MNDQALTDSKNLDRETDEFIAQMDRDEVKHKVKGAAILILFLVACLGFVGGALFVAKEVGLQVKTSFGVPDDETLSTRPGERP